MTWDPCLLLSMAGFSALAAWQPFTRGPHPSAASKKPSLTTSPFPLRPQLPLIMPTCHHQKCSCSFLVLFCQTVSTGGPSTLFTAESPKAAQ